MVSTDFLFAVRMFSTRGRNTFYSRSETFLFASRNIFLFAQQKKLPPGKTDLHRVADGINRTRVY